MIKSMTGYGKGTAFLSTGTLTIELRSLNSKSCDVSIKTSIFPKDREIEVRKTIADSLQRGTIDLMVDFEPKAGEFARTVNADIVKSYYSQICEIAASCGAPEDEGTYLGAILRFPDIIDSARKEAILQEEWPVVEKALDEAIQNMQAFRSKEGKVLYNDVTSRVARILELENQVEAREQGRIEKVRERILQRAAEVGVNFEKERFEQEMIFYIEKLDINEEKVRLRQHCRYFMDTIDGEEAPGKKLGFIIQEMGREINTTGSKANDADIQKLVVQMKDELEKIREQSMNIL